MDPLIEHCPCCLEPMNATCPALIAPFIRERALEGRTVPCRLLTCPSCAFRCFDTRFDAAELHRLYTGYRGEAYFQVRHRWEPWYSRSMNARLSESTEELRTRKKNFRALITRCLGAQPLAKVLDYGGDRGQFIPEEWPSEKYVYEISGREPLPGIHAVQHAQDLQGTTFDLVMLCHVLEHQSDPAQQLAGLYELIGDSGHLYVEVPLERPDLAQAGRWPWGPAGLAWLAEHPILVRLVDLYSTFFRIRRGLVPRFGFLKASEHLNFFTPESLTVLLGRLGFQVLACEPMGFDGAYAKNQAVALGCVARRAEAFNTLRDA